MRLAAGGISAMTDLDFFRLADSATAGRKDLDLAQALDYETGEYHHCYVVANLAATATKQGGKLYMPVRLNVGDRDERPSKFQDPPPIHLQVKSDLTADPITVDYGPDGLGTFRDPDADASFSAPQTWWLDTDDNTAPPANLLLYSQGTGEDGYDITYSLPTLTANPASDTTQTLTLVCDQPQGTPQDTATQQIHIARYAPRPLRQTYSVAGGDIISLIGASGRGTGSDHTLATFYENQSNRPVTAYFPNRPASQRLSYRGTHWTFALVDAGPVAARGGYVGSGWTLRISRDANPNGPHYEDTLGVIVPVKVETTDHGDKSAITLHFNITFL